MGTQPTGGGSTTSFTNTPQAKDDYYLYEEDWLRNSSFYNFLTNTISLDVMANDLGGNAKTLFSVEDGDGNPLTADYELLNKDVNASGCSPWEPTLLGNWVRINNGKIEYRLADGSGIPGQGIDVNSLNGGDVVCDQFVYAIRLGNGTLSEATVKITLFGTNDAASISGTATGDVVEDGTLTASGTLVVSDVDAGENELQPVAAGTAGDNGYGTFEVLANGQWTYSLSNGLAAVQALGDGETFQDSITVWSEDLSDSEVITITITGTNDAPVLTVDAAGGVTEDVGVVLGSVSDSGVLSFTDVDVNDGHSVSASYNGDASWTGGSLSAGQVAAISAGFSADSDSWDYSVVNADLDFLGAGESITLSFDVTVTDDSGSANDSDTETVTITITGTNDAPVLTVDAAGGVTEDVGVVLGSVSDSGVLSFTDVDVNDGHSVSASYNGDASWTGGSLSAGQVAAISAGFSADSDSWDYSVVNADLDFLGAGESITLSFDVTVTDDSGSANDSDTETVTITITGTNDAPVLSGAQATLAAGTEDVAYIISAASLLAGFSDAEGDTLAVASLGSAQGSIIDNGDGTYTFTPAADYNGLVTLTYSVVDGNGGVTPANQSFSLAAVNDPAVIGGTISGSVIEATPSDPGDPDATGTLTASDVDNPPDTFIPVASTPTASGYGSYTMSAGGVWTYTLDNGNAAVNALATGLFLIDTFTVQSADGTTQTITVTINGATDAVTPPPTFNGTGDPNDFDSLLSGSAAAGGPVSINGGNGADTLHGSNSALADTLNGGNGVDAIYGHDGGDTINGQNGADMSLYGQAGNDTITGGSAGDQIFGGSGNDTIYGNEPPPSNETGDASDTLYGGSGDDIIYGQGNADILIGGFGSDTQTGGGGADIFRYLSLNDTNDFITDFLMGTDQIDLSALDANSAVALDQAFGWGGDTPTANSLWFQQSGTDTVLFGDTDGNAATAEFMITLQNVSSFTPYSDPLDPPPPGFTF